MHVLPEPHARASRVCMHVLFVVFSSRLLASKQQPCLLNFVSGALKRCLFDTWVKREERADSILGLTHSLTLIYFTAVFELFSVLV